MLLRLCIGRPPTVSLIAFNNAWSDKDFYLHLIELPAEGKLNIASEFCADS